MCEYVAHMTIRLQAPHFRESYNLLVLLQPEPNRVSRSESESAGAQSDSGSWSMVRCQSK